MDAAIQTDMLYRYLKLFLDNGWILALAALASWLIINPKILENFSSIKIGSVVDLQLRDLREKLADTEQKVDQLQSRNDQLTQVIDSFDADGDLTGPRVKLKNLARHLKDEDLASVRKGLGASATHEELYAAAEIARSRRDPAFLDDLVDCLSRLASAPDLNGVRLKTVWTLTSALHLTLVSDLQHAEIPQVTKQQLLAARRALELLVQNPRVLGDSPDAPEKGVRGPAKNAQQWIERGLARVAA